MQDEAKRRDLLGLCQLTSAPVSPSRSLRTAPMPLKASARDETPRARGWSRMLAKGPLPGPGPSLCETYTGLRESVGAMPLKVQPPS